MPKLKYTKQECADKLIELQNVIGWDKSLTQNILEQNKLYKTTITHWGTLTNMRHELNLPELGIYNHGKYSEKQLIDILSDFIEHYGFFPSREYWDVNQKKLGLPSSAVYTRYFKSWKNIRNLFGYNIGEYELDKNGICVDKYDNKKKLLDLLQLYVKQNNKVPLQREFQKTYSNRCGYYIEKHYGSYTNFLKEGGYISRGNRKYSDDELKYYFMSFINEHHRVPTIREFNNIKGYPSTKSYVDRFGSWGKACIHYGFKPNERQPEYYLDNGEICDSSFEFEVSTWLIKNNIEYTRNIPYKDLDSKYNGMMNCDYLIHYKNTDWYVEIAGMLSSRSYIPTSSETILYHKKLQRKEKILKRNKLNYRFIYGDDFKNNSIEDLFAFLTVN